jgi:hypothetical protein
MAVSRAYEISKLLQTKEVPVYIESYLVPGVSAKIGQTWEKGRWVLAMTHEEEEHLKHTIHKKLFYTGKRVVGWAHVFDTGISYIFLEPLRCKKPVGCLEAVMECLSGCNSPC